MLAGERSVVAREALVRQFSEETYCNPGISEVWGKRITFPKIPVTH